MCSGCKTLLLQAVRFKDTIDKSYAYFLKELKVISPSISPITCEDLPCEDVPETPLDIKNLQQIPIEEDLRIEDVPEIPLDIENLLQIPIEEVSDGEVDETLCEIVSSDVVIPDDLYFVNLKYSCAFPHFKTSKPYVPRRKHGDAKSVLRKNNADLLTEEEADLEQRMVESGWFICKLCEEEVDYGKLSTLKDHLKETHPDCKRYSICCSMNIKKFHSEMYDHMRFHVNPDRLKCPHCEMRCKRKNDLERHILIIHVQSIRCVCEFCGKGFGSLGLLNTHKANSHTYKCRKCQIGKQFIIMKS